MMALLRAPKNPASGAASLLGYITRDMNYSNHGGSRRCAEKILIIGGGFTLISSEHIHDEVRATSELPAYGRWKSSLSWSGVPQLARSLCEANACA